MISNIARYLENRDIVGLMLTSKMRQKAVEPNLEAI